MYVMRLLIKGLMVTFIGLTGCAGTVDGEHVLLPTSTDQWESSDITLSCTCSACGTSQWKFVNWYNYNIQPDVFFTVEYTNGNCSSIPAPLLNTSLYSYGCSRDMFNLTLKNISRRNAGDIWACRTSVLAQTSNNVTIQVKVPVYTVRISPVEMSLNINENSTIPFHCTTSPCRPQPLFRWYVVSKNVSSPLDLTTASTTVSSNSIQEFSSTFSLIVNRTLNGWSFYCEASNRIDTPAVKSKNVTLNVLYPPDNPVRILGVENGSVYNVIIGNQVNLTCAVTGGNPLSQLKWNPVVMASPVLNGDTVKSDAIWQAKERNQTQMQCRSIHPFINQTAYVVIDVLYPPDAPDLKILNVKNKFQNIVGKIKVIENRTMTLTCTADSKPLINLFTWSRFSDDNRSTLVVSNIQRGDAGPLSCQVYNRMVPTVGSSVTGNNTSKIYIDVQYPPEVLITANKTLIEGEDLSYDCVHENGNPNTTMFRWINITRGNVVQTGKVLQLTRASRNATGWYECVAENTMNSTDGISKQGTGNGRFFLDMQYAANVSKFTVDSKSENNTTFNENHTLTIECNIEGNPAPDGSIFVSTTGYEEKRKELVGNFTSETNFVFVASCYHAGEYSCTGNNILHNGERRTSTKSVIININCAPRMSKFHKVEHRVYTSINVPVTLTFTAVAYPVPPISGYTWFRQINESYWTNITRTRTTYNVSTQGLQSNLTVTNVTKSDYGLYNLTISNNIGTFTFTFTLIPTGKPVPPVKFGILEETVTDSSVTIWWEPEFNGGDTQRFIVSYKTSSSDAWLNLSSILEETTTSMTLKIGDLKSGTVYHFLIYAENKNGSVKIASDIVVQTKEVYVPATSSIVGAAAGGVLVIAIIVAAVLFLRSRAQRKRSPNSHEYMDNSFENFSEDRSKDTKNGKNFDDKIHLVSTKTQYADSPILPARQPTKRETAIDMLEPIDFDDKKPEDGIYGNTYEMIRRIERLEIAELVAYLSDKPAEFFRLEYQKLPQRLIHPYNDSQLPENLPLNRYKGIYPYDHSRVKDFNDPKFFVNASYIDGHKKKKEYIASLGPLERTSKHFVTFWQMVWSEKSDVVVMLTKLIEPTGEKCEKYWPEFGTSLTYGEITVTGTGEDEFADYILRTFALTKGKETRKFLQYHFMAWPDKSIPENTACLLEFRRTVRSKHKTGPIIVHCSAGIGRTGTFIAIDILIEEGKHKGAVNVLQCVKKMRDQRTMMVQTVEQYHYIFKAVVNALVFDNDAIAVKAYPKAMSKIKGNRIQEMYECLNKSVETDSTAESTARTVNKTQRDKNRVDSDIPGDEHRVRLFLDRDADMSDYINAVYVNSFIKSNYFIGAQSPLPNKVEDFLAMIVQVECSCIVSLEEMAQGQAMGMYHPSDSTTLKIGKFRISSKVLDSRETYTVSKMSITYKGQREERQKNVYHFQYTDWPHGQKVPINQENFIKFTKDVETFAKQCCTQESHALVHCLNAFERSCLFCAVVILTQKVDVEGEVCVPNILRMIRSRRRKAFPNKEQFEFCFNVVNTYIGMEKSTDTADDKTYMNTALA